MRKRSCAEPRLGGGHSHGEFERLNTTLLIHHQNRSLPFRERHHPRVELGVTISATLCELGYSGVGDFTLLTV